MTAAIRTENLVKRGVPGRPVQEVDELARGLNL